MKNKEDIINEIISKNGYNDYLELGSQNGFNLSKINCKNKTSVDIEHDADFKGSTNDFFKQNDKTFDCIMIDADHEASQVRLDISNSLKALTENGCIILHDTIPHSKAMQEVPRNTKEWTGDVWRAVVGFKQSYPDVKIETYRSDYGLSVIYPEGKKVKKHFENKEMTFGEFKADEVNLLNIID